MRGLHATFRRSDERQKGDDVTTQGWIGLGFVALLVIFFMVAFFMKNLTPSQEQILRFLAALCAGFAGALLAGEALFSMNTQLQQGSSLAVRGTAGFALFFAVWYGFRQVAHGLPSGPEALSFSVPPGWTFRGAVDALATNDNAVAKFVDFPETALNTVLRAREIHTGNVTEAILALRELAEPGALPLYDVIFNVPTYQLRAKT